jgi:endoglucanase
MKNKRNLILAAVAVVLIAVTVVLGVNYSMSKQIKNTGNSSSVSSLNSSTSSLKSEDTSEAESSEEVSVSSNETESSSSVSSSSSSVVSSDVTSVTSTESSSGSSLPASTSKPVISENTAKLHVTGTNLCDSTDNPIILHGMSSHGMQWYSDFINTQSLTALKSRGANLVRLAMYTEEGGYKSDSSIKEKVYNACDEATALNMYVIIDWHILSDGNPVTNESDAMIFFNEVSKKYADNPYVIYEICNEPNGNVTWSGDVKPYAEMIIPIIRANSPDSVIIVGTPTWSQDVDIASEDPLNFPNVMYACHFYAGTHGKSLMDKIDKARSNGAAIFVSEWGTSDASGSGGVFLDESQQWIDFMSSRNICWANWSLCDKDESSAALLPGASKDGTWTDSNLSESGKFVFNAFK